MCNKGLEEQRYCAYYHGCERANDDGSKGVPTGWDEEPVIGTGICQTEITKTTAPIRDNRGDIQDQF